MIPAYHIPMFSPVRLHRPVKGLFNGQVRGRTIEPDPRYDIVLQDGVTVVAGAFVDQFTVIGPPEPQTVIAWEGTKS